jgi:hypothetical protein
MMPLMPCLRMTALSESETMAHDWRQTGQAERVSIAAGICRPGC